jgi:hypothetical protein
LREGYGPRLCRGDGLFFEGREGPRSGPSLPLYITSANVILRKCSQSMQRRTYSEDDLFNEFEPQSKYHLWIIVHHFVLNVFRAHAEDLFGG